MATFNGNKAKQIGSYGTVTMTIGDVIRAINAGRVLIPREQRAMENKRTEKYKEKAIAFITDLLLHTFCSSPVDDKTIKVLKDTFGSDIVIENNVAQFIGLSIDEDGFIYLSDGQHRFMHYLLDWMNGIIVIPYGMNSHSDFTENAIRQLFECVDLKEGDGCENENKYIAASMLNKQDMNKLMNYRVIATVVASRSADERAALFIAMNTCTVMKQYDLLNAAYGHYNAWQAIASVHASLTAVDIHKNEPITFECGKQYNANDAKILRMLFWAKNSTFVPFVAHAGLLTYLNKKQRSGEYQWLKSSEQSQATQVANFFKATENMTREECDKMLVKMMDDVVKIGHKFYDNNDSLMARATGLRSLIVGQMHAFRTVKAKKDVLYEIAAGITIDVLSEEYIPVNSTRSYGTKHFNNGHKNRVKNEKFCEWVIAEMEKRGEQ